MHYRKSCSIVLRYKRKREMTVIVMWQCV